MLKGSQVRNKSLYLKETKYEIKVYNFFPGYFKAQAAALLEGPGLQGGLPSKNVIEGPL